MVVFNVTVGIFMTIQKFVAILRVQFFTELGQNVTEFVSGDLTRTVFVEDLQAFEEFFIASWIWSLGDGPQMWEEIIQTDGLFGQLRLWHSVDFHRPKGGGHIDWLGCNRNIWPSWRIQSRRPNAYHRSDRRARKPLKAAICSY